MKWIRKKVSIKAYSCSLKDIFLLLKALKSEFKSKKCSSDTLLALPLLECQVLFSPNILDWLTNLIVFSIFLLRASLLGFYLALIILVSVLETKLKKSKFISVLKTLPRGTCLTKMKAFCCQLLSCEFTFPIWVFKQACLWNHLKLSS